MRLAQRIFNAFEGVGMAVDSIRSNKVRAALTILGVAIGVFVVVAMSSVVRGINESFARDLEAAGPTSFYIYRRPISGFNFAAIGTLPLTHEWELFARGGVLFSTNKIRLVVNATGQQFLPAPGSFTASGSDDTQETFAAVGISRRFFEIYDLRLEYQRVFDAGTPDAGGEGDLDVAMLGLNVTF